jgi:hypothetical protein
VPSAELLLIFSMLRCNTAISACFMSGQLRMWSTSAVVLRTGGLYNLLDASASPRTGIHVGQPDVGPHAPRADQPTASTRRR